MELQRAIRWGSVLAMLSLVGCAMVSAKPSPPVYHLVSSSRRSELSGVRVYESRHYLLCTTLYEPSRVAPMIATLEAAYEQYVAVTGIRPPEGAPLMSVFVFQTRAEWEAFTRRTTGVYAPLYLKLDRGGYTFDNVCAVREQGSHDTLTVLAHEGLHLFVATHFQARPPPFLEEGIACLFEHVRDGDEVTTIDITSNAARSSRLAALLSSGEPLPSLRSLMTMHAGNVVGLPGPTVDAFYSQAWAFVRFLNESGDPVLRQSFARMMADASTHALSSDSLPDDPALVERYLGRTLESIEPAYRAFAAKLAE